MATSGDKIIVENVNTPGKTARVDAAKYAAMHAALTKVFSEAGAPLTQSEMMTAVKPHLPNDLFPGGATSGWWVKTVQLDLEAKGVMRRDGSKPLKWEWAT